MTIEQHISALLFHYDCVIIPGLGGFVSHHSPARVLSDRELAFPPSKGIIFNKHLITNDGLLADALVREEGISFSEANTLLADFVTTSREKLFRNERVVFEGLGVLYLDREHNIQFQPDFSVNFLIDSFGLYPVTAREVVKLIVPEEKAERIQEALPKEEAKVVAFEPAVKSRKWRYVAAAAVLLPVVFYSVWIPTRTNFLQTGHLSIADLNPFSSSVPAYEHRTNALASGIDRVEDEWKKLVVNAGGPVTKLDLNDKGQYLNIYVTGDLEISLAAESTFVAKESTIKKENHAHLIGGCFRELANAEKLVADLKSKGHPAFILDEVGGLYRVSVESFPDKESANQALSQLKAEGLNNVWLLVK
jgi:cell division septation protein DedD